MMRVGQVGEGLGSRQNAEPTDGIDLLEGPEHRAGNIRPTDTVEPVATGDKITVELLLDAVLAVGHAWRAGEVVQRHVFGLGDHDPVVGIAGRVQVLGDLRLAVDHHGPARVLLCIDAQAMCSGPDDEAAVVRLALAVHAFAHAGRPQHLDGAPLQHTGTCATEHVLAGLSLEHDAVDAVPVRDLRKQQPGRPASDDRDLGLHVVMLFIPGFVLNRIGTRTSSASRLFAAFYMPSL